MTQIALIPKQDLIRPPEPEEFHSDMTMLLSAFPSQQRQEPAQVIATYMIALEGYSAAAIHAGILKFIRGEWPGHDAVWLPSPGMASRAVKAASIEIAKQIEMERDKAILDRARARAKAKAEAEARHAKQIELEHARRTPEERAAWVEKLKRGLQPKPEMLSDD